MGRSTVAQLITRAKNMNEYDNHGVANDSIWVMHFNSALSEMTEYLNIDEKTEINYIYGQDEYELPDDFYSMIIVNDRSNQRIAKLRHMDQQSPAGYWVVNRGDKFKILLKGFYGNETLTIRYTRYPALLDEAQKDTQHPEVPNIAEDALCYKAIMNALLNNNQVGKAQAFDGMYRNELAKINIANNRARS
jgi:hypothetical protein